MVAFLYQNTYYAYRIVSTIKKLQQSNPNNSATNCNFDRVPHYCTFTTYMQMYYVKLYVV